MNVSIKLCALILIPLFSAGCSDNNQAITETTSDSPGDTFSIEGSWQITEISFAGMTSVELSESGSVTYYTDDSLYTFHYPFYSNPSYAYRRNGSELIYLLENGKEKKWRLNVTGNELQLIDKTAFGDNIHKYQKIQTDEQVIQKLIAIEVDWSHFNSFWSLDTTASNFLYQNTKIDSKSPVPSTIDLRVSNSANFTTNKRTLIYTDSENIYSLWFLAYRPDRLNFRLIEDTLNIFSDTLVFVRN